MATSDAVPGAIDVSAEVRGRVQQIYQSIIARTPEHDFDPTIQRVADLMDLLGSPQRSYRVIQLTGTNGKTSTARMIDSLVTQLNLRVGRFTSPHLSDVRERIVIDGQPISHQAFIDTWEDIAPYVGMIDAQLAERGESQLSFFEVLTAMAFVAFGDAPVDVAVLEVGMGGAWDSTNVADAEVAVFTPISLDHQRWLGSTLTEIAEVKSGIIKNITPHPIVVSGEQDEDVARVIAQRAVICGAPVVAAGFDLHVVERQVAVGGQVLALRTPSATYADIFLPLHGAHQADNALVALGVVEQLMGGGSLSAEVVEAGFAAVSSPGRMELVRSSPTIVVDAAHNPAGTKALAAAISEAFAFSRLVGVIGVMADKDAHGMIAELAEILDEVVVTTVDSVRGLPASDLAEIARDVFDDTAVHEEARLPEAIVRAVDLAEAEQIDGISSGTGVLIVGSVVLAGSAREIVVQADR